VQLFLNSWALKKIIIVKYTRFTSDYFNVEANVSRFAISEKPTVYHVAFKVTRKNMSFDEQLNHIQGALKEFNSTRIPQAKPVFVRYFLSDATNQLNLLQRTLNNTPCAVSIVEQPPLNGTKISLLCVFQTEVEIESSTDAFIAKHNGYSHIWNTCLRSSHGSAEEQTENLIGDYRELLRKHNITIADNCIRTWFFIQNIAAIGNAVSKSCKSTYDKIGVSRPITSLVIEGNHSDAKYVASLDAYALKGLKPEQITNYNSEAADVKGTIIQYGDRRHVIAGGVMDAKLDASSACDVCKQADYVLDNMSALLTKAGAALSDLASVIIYLRDYSDYTSIKAWAAYRLPDVPKIFVQAASDSKDSLITIETEAFVENKNENFAEY